MAELKPCKCGCTYNIFIKQDMVTGLYFVLCENCKKSTGLFKTKQQAIDAWNKRSLR